MTKTHNKYLAVSVCVLLALLTLAAYWQVVNCDFVGYDDNVYVSANRHVKAGLVRGSLTWAFTTAHANNWHPVTWLSHMLDYQVFGLRPGGHHVVNVLLHIANALLLFEVLRRMTGRASKGALWRCAAVAALFAVHPLHVESVAWVAERKDVLSALFWLLVGGGLGLCGLGLMGFFQTTSKAKR